METINVKINGMSCGHCTNFVKTTVEELNGIKSCEVDLETANAQITYDATQIKPQAIKEAINDTHFEVAES